MGDIKLIASDIDGTLLFDWRARTLGPEVLEAVGRALDAGIVFVAASGRQCFNMRNLFGPYADRLVYICENGTLALWGEKVLYKAKADRGELLVLARSVLATDHLHLLLSGTKACYVSADDPAFFERMGRGLGNLTMPFGSPEDINDDLVKVGIWFADPTDPETLAEVEEIKARFADSFEIVTSGSDWYDVVPHGQNKAVALEAVGRTLGIKPVDMVAFGDNFNDVPMLNYVGHPYLMESGNPNLRNLNPRLCLCNNVPQTIHLILDNI